MTYNEAETRFYLIDPILREKGYDDHQWLKLETPAPVEPTDAKGRRRRGKGRTDTEPTEKIDIQPYLKDAFPDLELFERIAAIAKFISAMPGWITTPYARGS